jgi:hypothetical protein
VLENATSPFIIGGASAFAGRIAVELGELDEAERLLERAWALVQDSGGFQLIGPAIAALVLLEIRRGDLHRAPERARDGVTRAMAVTTIWSTPPSCLGSACASRPSSPSGRSSNRESAVRVACSSPLWQRAWP